jgi:hypothetical protein
MMTTGFASFPSGDSPATFFPKKMVKESVLSAP